MSWVDTGQFLRPILERVQQLSRDQLLALGDGWDAPRSHRLRDAVRGDIQLGWEFGLFPSEVFEISREFDSVVHDAGLLPEEKACAWEAVSDVLTVRLLGSPSSDTGRADHRAVIELWDASTRRMANAGEDKGP
jgi:hypothetical protein